MFMQSMFTKYILFPFFLVCREYDFKIQWFVVTGPNPFLCVGVLVSIISLLADPNCSSPANVDAGVSSENIPHKCTLTYLY